MIESDKEKLLKEMGKYKWYHNIKVKDDLYTNPDCPDYKRLWDFNFECMKGVDFSNKRVLDIGCRDGLFSFDAERRGAKEVIGIDNNISKGATEFLIPLFGSKVKMYELNLYDLTPEKFGTFDIIIFFGVLYHLRYPVWGLKKIADCLSKDGILLIESGMLTEERNEKELLYCPVERSPYEITSCTFFNKKGLCVTMETLNFQLLNYWAIDSVKEKDIGKYLIRSVGKLKRILIFLLLKRKTEYLVTRQFFIFKKDMQLENSRLKQYWNSTHIIHTD